MKKAYKRQRRRMFWLIFAFVFVVCTAVITAYAVITYNGTKDSLVYDLQNEAIDEFAALRVYQGNEDEMTYAANSVVHNNPSSGIEYLEIKGAAAGSGTIASTDNVFTSSEFGIKKDNENSYGYLEYWIDYDNFRNSMTDEQYNKICDYLQSTPDEDGMRYALVCTAFYSADAQLEILPQTVEIVKTCDDYVWHAQDETVEKIELSPNAEAAAGDKDINNYTLNEISDMYRNEIDSDFVLGKWADDYERLGEFAADISSAGKTLRQTGDFTYAYIYVSDFRTYELSTYKVLEEDTGEYTEVIVDAEYYAVFLGEFNVLDHCLENIVWVSLIILAFFAVMCAVMEFAVIHTFNSRVRQEQKRVEMTNAFAHNMKTPIQVITGFAENMERKIQTDDARHYTEVIKRQAFSMDKLVRRMLDYTRLDFDGIKPSRTDFALRELVDEIINAHEDCAREFDIDTDPAVTINADRQLLKLALENLIENAVKYSPAGSVVKISGSGGRFEISNPCESISKADLKKLWQPYFRLNRNSEKGNGIGLSIVSSVMKLHKFKFGAKTENNVIMFYFEF